MAENQAAYLQAVSDALRARATAALDDPLLYARRIAAVVLAEAKDLPALRREAAASFAALAPQIVAALDGNDAADALRNELAGAPEAGIEALVQRAIPLLMADETPHARALLDRIAAIDCTLLGALQAGVDAASRPLAHATGDDALEADERRALREFLRARFAEDDALELAHIRRVVGGYSKETLIVELRHNAALPPAIVIRHDRHALKNGETGLVEEWSLLNTLHDAGIAVPRPLAIEAEGKVLSGPFIVMHKVEGRNIGDTFDAYGGSAAVALDLAACLAKLHRLPPEHFGAGIAGAGVDSRTRMRGLIAQFEAEWRSWNRPSTLLETAFGWLTHNLDVVGAQRALVHGDIGFHNFLVSDDRIAALLDWEIASIGHPAQDLGYAYHSVVKLVEWPRFMDAYAAAGAAAPSQAEIDFFSIWASVWRTTITLRCKLAFDAGHLGGAQFAYPSAYLMQRESLMLAEKLKHVLQPRA